MSWKLRVFQIFRSNNEKNLGRNIDPREWPLVCGKLTEGKARTVLIRQCIDIKQAEVNATKWASSTEKPVTQPREMEVRSTNIGLHFYHDSWTDLQLIFRSNTSRTRLKIRQWWWQQLEHRWNRNLILMDQKVLNKKSTTWKPINLCCFLFYFDP